EIEVGEVCDDGINDGSYGGCTPDCQALGPYCGDGQLDGPESCDDGDGVDGNGCNNDCNESGQPLWTVTYDHPSHDSDTASGVALMPCANELIGDEHLPVGIGCADEFVVTGSVRRNDLNQRNNL